MDPKFSFTQKNHFGSILILGRSGWGKTQTVKNIIQLWNRNIEESVVELTAEDYTSWNKWQEATITITNGYSIFARFNKQVETYIIEDIQSYFFWTTSVRLKFLEQIQKIAKHSNIIITMDPFGLKIPKIWTNPSSWSHIIKLTLPNMMERMNFCKQNDTLKKLNTSQISYLLETTQDVSFRTLERIAHFLEQSLIDNKMITFSVLRQATLNTGEIHLPPGLFSNAQEFVKNPNISSDDLERMYLEEPFHFPYLIWNTLPSLCYHNGKGWDTMLNCYIHILDSITGVDDKSQKRRVVAFQRMYLFFHQGWKVSSSVIFQIPNIRNKISYVKVRKKLLEKVVEQAEIPPMFVMERCHQDLSIRDQIPDTIKNKHL